MIKFIGYTLLVICSIIISGYAVMKLWEWFISNTFGIIKLNLVQAIGFDLLFTFLKMTSKKEDDDEEFYYPFLKAIIASLFVLFFGYILTLFLN